MPSRHDDVLGEGELEEKRAGLVELPRSGVDGRIGSSNVDWTEVVLRCQNRRVEEKKRAECRG